MSLGMWRLMSLGKLLAQLLLSLLTHLCYVCFRCFLQQPLWPVSWNRQMPMPCSSLGKNPGGQMSMTHIWAFLGFCILMGINRLPALHHYWSADLLFQYHPIAECTFRGHFLSIWWFLHFSTTSIRHHHKVPMVDQSQHKVTMVDIRISLINSTRSRSFVEDPPSNLSCGG